MGAQPPTRCGWRRPRRRRGRELGREKQRAPPPPHGGQEAAAEIDRGCGDAGSNGGERCLLQLCSDSFFRQQQKRTQLPDYFSLQAQILPLFPSPLLFLYVNSAILTGIGSSVAFSVFSFAESVELTGVCVLFRESVAGFAIANDLGGFISKVSSKY